MTKSQEVEATEAHREEGILASIRARQLMLTREHESIPQSGSEESAPVSYTHLTLPTTPYV